MPSVTNSRQPGAMRRRLGDVVAVSDYFENYY